MTKYLRYLACGFGTGNTDRDWRDGAYPRHADADIGYLDWMYECYALPLRADNVAKVNVCFTIDSPNSAPFEDGLGIVDVWEFFDIEKFDRLSAVEQQRYFLDRLHAALMNCAEHFGWDSKPLEEAHARIIREAFNFSFFWKKPVTSPDRRTKAQLFVDVVGDANLYLVFFDRNMAELRRMLFSVVGAVSGVPEQLINRISWDDNQTVRLLCENERDYWLVKTAGDVEFRYPRAQTGDPQGEFDLGRIYYEGMGVLQDKERGLKLIEAAAAKGFKHAIRFLEHVHSVDSRGSSGMEKNPPK